MHKESSVVYFEKAGPDNTDIALRAALDRAVKSGVDHIVVASGRGGTAMQLASLAEARGYEGQIVVVTSHAGFFKPGQMTMAKEVRDELEKNGAKIFVGTHVLSSVSRSFRQRWQGIDMLEIIAEVLRRFSEGIKVCVEISIMAADAGLIPVDRDVIAVGGTGGGADSAMVLRPAHMNGFFDLKVREIIAMPLAR